VSFIAPASKRPKAQDAAGYSHDENGFITGKWLAANTPIEEADFYLCGPKPFLRAKSQ
jgi:nitric oxide dioxygenase